MKTLPQNRAELLQQIETEWQRLQDALSQFTVEEVITPQADGWSIKDHLAHLTHWEQWLLRYHIQGETAAALQIDTGPSEDLDVDQINELVRQRSRSLLLDETLYEFHATHAQVIATLTELPFDKLLEPRYAADPARRPLLQWVIDNTYDHYQEHSAALVSQKEIN
ncbi:MAG: ClbS/DfsB family four-helix bundle protein [Caldilineaceae bacterium]|nr:ClbS/DfsB family four-helix bundle protein [Caldilineaceae bacterium]